MTQSVQIDVVSEMLRYLDLCAGDLLFHADHNEPAFLVFRIEQLVGSRDRAPTVRTSLLDTTTREIVVFHRSTRYPAAMDGWRKLLRRASFGCSKS